MKSMYSLNVMATLNFRTLDLNLLRVFNEVMTERSLTRAAHKLSLTQPAVSNAIQRLRSVLGDELLQRQGQGVAPTPRALALWPQVQDALRQLQHTLAPEMFVPSKSTHAFVLAMADSTAAELFPGLMDVMDHQAPGVSIRALPLTTRDPRQLLNDELADMAIGYFPAVMAGLTAQSQAGEVIPFEHQRLYSSNYVCVMRRGHPLAQQSLSLDDYCNARHLLVSFSGRPYGFVDEALAFLERKRRIVLTVNQFFTAGRVVANSNLLTVLPRHFFNVTGYADQLLMRELPFEVPAVHVDAVWHRRLQHDGAHQWLRSVLLHLPHLPRLGQPDALAAGIRA